MIFSDRLIALVSALGIHGAILFGSDAFFVRPAEYGVETGAGSLEVSLVAAPADESRHTEEALDYVQDDEVVQQDEMVSREDVTKEVSVKGDGSSPVPGEDETTYFSTGGAIAESTPGYLKNPAPRYPELARQRGEEGLVILWAYVSALGEATRVEIRQSSGFPLLDEAAIKAVRRWKFQPARVGSMAMDSTVQIPIRFQLKESDRS